MPSKKKSKTEPPAKLPSIPHINPADIPTTIDGALGFALRESKIYIDLLPGDLTMRRFMDETHWNKDRARDWLGKLEDSGKIVYAGRALERDRGGMMRAVKVWRLPDGKT